MPQSSPAPPDAGSRVADTHDRSSGKPRSARTPLLEASPDTCVSVLSPRECEVALLAASGLSSKVIAGRLSLSLRTVENHLGRAYTKLGVSNQTGLAALFNNSSDDNPIMNDHDR
jgi:DNA-binding CsgD family transcriptional regulator